MTNFRNNLFGKRRWVLSILLFAVSFEFVSCGAADIQSAKAYRQKRDFERANTMLERALKEEPTNDEAWYLYVVNLYDLNQLEKIADVIDTAMLYSVSHRAELENFKRDTWGRLFYGGYQAYNENPESAEAQQAAIHLLETAQKLSPDQPETYDLLGNIYIDGVHDTAKAVEIFSKELNAVSASHQQGVAMGLMLNQSPASVERAIGGAPAQKRMIPITQSDSAMIYTYPSKMLYVYFEHPPKNSSEWRLTGWRVTPIENQGLQVLRFSTTPYIYVANRAYLKGREALANHDTATATQQFDQAIPLLVMLQQVDPSNDDAAKLIPQMYTQLNRMDKAKDEYRKYVAEHPTREAYVNYGTLLMNSQDYPGAAQQFQKALDIDPNYPSALYDLAATYRNWAKADQDAKKPATVITDELKKSTDFFERLHNLDRRNYDYIDQLFYNYKLLKLKDKAVSLLAELEGWKTSDAANDAQYWQLLGQLYAFTDRPKDSEAAFKHADQLSH
jgi:tetratricopeptide (TPR) repeat protein